MTVRRIHIFFKVSTRTARRTNKHPSVFGTLSLSQDSRLKVYQKGT